MNHAFVAALADAGHTAESLADQLGVHPKTVARWANPGHIPQTRHRSTVAELLGRETDALWPDVIRRREPVWFRPWVDIEREATTLRTFELAWVPGLLQIEPYARATLVGRDADGRRDGGSGRSPARPAGDPAPGARAAAGRGAGRGRPAAAGGRRRGAHGGPARASARLRRAAERAAARRAGRRTQLSRPGRPFVIADMPAGSRVAHVDGPAQAQILDQPSDLANLERRWERIRGEALPRGRSLDLVKEAAASWS